ncbi:hypothetical protein [Shewanella saliphila]|uniref:Uncharacterized protein n=1 Tax=Shewanella saliphila TaxID=2282698 RepID=A0ABQ2Q430_9GAMM|nr:hypothetical protein [Shewanella saliphila]MCL1101269.1 hypothetical protein [Shewanella saliphila]GGP47667.1 hypothetical protein GCM10009409_12850 [Shewanella saliphila]
MNSDIPKWPEDLPLPVSVEKLGRLISLTPSDLKTEDEINNLVHNLYWYPDDFYFIFTKVNEGFGEFLFSRFEQSGMVYTKNERCFYIHSFSDMKNDFIQLPPDTVEFDWHKEAILGQEYSRFTIKLASWKIKELDMVYTAEATVKVMDEATPIIEAKPGLFGININLCAILSKVKRWWNSK